MSVFELPSYGLTQCLVEPVESIGRHRFDNGAAIGLTETMETIVRCQVVTLPLTRLERAEWRAWRNKLRGGINQFRMYDFRQCAPHAYVGSTSPDDISSGWDGTANVTDLGLSGALGLSGVPEGVQISTDDWIGLEENGRYDVYAAIAPAVANASNEVTVTVSPFLRTGIFSTSAIARLWRPMPAFVIESFEDPPQHGRQPIAFTGTQRI